MKKTFDAVAFMRLRREEIDREDAGLTWKQKREKTRQTLEKDALWRHLRDRSVQSTPPETMTAREKTEGIMASPTVRTGGTFSKE